VGANSVFLTGFLAAVVVTNYLFARFLSKAHFINFGFLIKLLGGIFVFIHVLFTSILVAYVWFVELNVD
jgi:multisubunit Na+/H+ antiporter MnhE subunit